MSNKSIEFFDTQFQKQVREQDFALNRFEEAAIDYLKGDILDLGCGLGNLSLEAARRAHSVVAVDASQTAIERLHAQAALENLPLQALHMNILDWPIDSSYDTVICIGLLMFFPKPDALRLLERLQSKVRSGGRAIVNVLTDKTTFMEMFQPGHYYLFGSDELEQRFCGWNLLLSRVDHRPAPNQTSKVFATVIAEKP